MNLRKVFASLFQSAKSPSSSADRTWKFPKRGEEAKLDFQHRGEFFQELQAAYREVGLPAFLPMLKQSGLSTGERAIFLSELSETLRVDAPRPALELAQAAHEASPQPARARALAVCHFENGDFEEAERFFQEVVNGGGKLSRLHQSLRDETRARIWIRKEMAQIPQRIAAKTPDRSGKALLWFARASITHSWGTEAIRVQEIMNSTEAPEVTLVTRFGYPYDVVRTTSRRGPALSCHRHTVYHHFRQPSLKLEQDEYVRRSVEIMRDLVEAQRPVAIVAPSDLTVALPALSVARECGVPFVYDLDSATTQPEEQRFFVREADYVIAASASLAEQAREWGAAEDRVFEISTHFAALPEMVPSSAEGDFRVAFAGALESDSGVEDLVEAVIDLRQSGQAIRLFLLGEGSLTATLTERLSQATSGDDEPWWSLLSEAPSSVWRAHLAGSHAFILPTREGGVEGSPLPMTLLEAMALSIPVAASDLPLHREAVRSGESGLLFRPSDRLALQESILRLMNDRPGAAAMATAAKAWIAKERVTPTLGAEFFQRLACDGAPSENNGLIMLPMAANYETAGLGEKELWSLFGELQAEGIKSARRGGEVEITSERDTACLLRSERLFSPQELMFTENGLCQLQAHATRAEIEGLYLFFNEADESIGQFSFTLGEPHTFAIPSDCHGVRLALQLQGGGAVRLQRWITAPYLQAPVNVTPKNKTLLITRLYPSYKEIYRYAFIHSRLRAYRREGVPVDVYELGAFDNFATREFEGVEVTSLGQPLLRQIVAMGGYRTALVHFLQTDILSVLLESLDRMKVIVWVHGSDIQSWRHRQHDLLGEPPSAVERQKQLSAIRHDFWRRIFGDLHPNLHLVFVSQSFAEQCFSDIGIRLPEGSYSIIHNFIDTDLFPYRPKRPEHRLRLLSIRPFRYRTHANDLTVAAIQELSQRPFFHELHFRIIGDGPLFDSLTAPLREFPNVVLEKRFLQQAEIAALHADYGVMLIPTRADTQGVSRDEAMSSGLVPITSRVAAIPEFADESCGFLTEPESAVAIADAVERLYHHPDEYLEMSAAAAARVRRQSSAEQTVMRELALIRSSLADD